MIWLCRPTLLTLNKMLREDISYKIGKDPVQIDPDVSYSQTPELNEMFKQELKNRKV